MGGWVVGVSIEGSSRYFTHHWLFHDQMDNHINILI